MAEVCLKESDIVSLHDLLEYQDKSNLSFWQFAEKWGSDSEINWIETVVAFFEEYPDKLKRVVCATAIDPFEGYYSNQYSSWLYSVVSQIFFMSKPSSKDQILIFRFCDDVAEIADLELCGVKGAVLDGGIFSDDDFRQILQRVLGKNVGQMRQGELIEKLVAKAGVVTDKLCTSDLKEKLNSPDEKVAMSWTLETAINPDIITFKRMLYEICQQGERGVEAKNKLMRSINEKIGCVDDIIYFLFEEKKVAKKRVRASSSVNIQGISKNKLLEYYKKHVENEVLGNFVITPCSCLSDNFRSFEAESVRGVFYVSTGSSKLEAGVEELIRKTEVTACELCNVGTGSLGFEFRDIDICVQNYLTMVSLRPSYLHVESIEYMAAYCKTSFHNVLMQMIYEVAGFGSCVFHPKLCIRDNVERFFSMTSLLSENIVNRIEAILNK